MPKKVKLSSRWPSIRKVFNNFHLWMGLTSGIILIAVCLSGTIYVYNTELRELASPKLHYVSAEEHPMPIDGLISKIKEASEGTVTAVSIPNDKEKSYQFSVRTEGDKSRFGTTYYVNPYNGDILGNSLEQTKMDVFMRDMFSLHRWLFLDRIEEPLIGGLENRKLGSYITGTATILFTLGALTGLIIWFPNRLKSWRQGLKVKVGKSWKRTNHDLHNTLGFYSFIFLFLMGITGPQWSFDWYRDGLRKVLGTYEAPQNRQQAGGPQRQKSGERPKREAKETAVTEDTGMPNFLNFDRYLSAADQALPYQGNYRISLPKSDGELIAITKNRVGFFAPAAGDQVKMDVANAELKEINIFSQKPLNERVSSSIKAIHIGDVYGSFTKLLYFIACLIATTLPITGTLIWINKMKKSGSSKRRENRKLPSKGQPNVVINEV